MPGPAQDAEGADGDTDQKTGDDADAHDPRDWHGEHALRQALGWGEVTAQEGIGVAEEAERAAIVERGHGAAR
ncbi:MAG: hypothetical protein HZB39_01880 [Planctomycetes bacterium]|nr:hypothetical protein [Planctomycetota bacterium]